MASMNLRGALTTLLLFGQLLSPVHTLPLQAAQSAAETSTEAAVTPGEKQSAGMEGIASYYAKRYNGRRTNSGQRYSPEKLTAAHPTLPHGTRVKVVNLGNDREVVVTVNDRCRKRKGPFIDLSRAAAKQLGFLGKGTAKVRIITLDEESS
jgi:peptidoglycan lytic transglycosylase